VVQLTFRCASKTNLCVADCGQAVPICWQRRGKAKAKKGTQLPCACGQKAHDHRLQCKCQPGVEQQRAHFNCMWSIQVLIAGPEFSEFSVYAGSKNSKVHKDSKALPLQQLRRKLPESTRDDFDKARIRDKTAPKQFAICMPSAV
jgi:hypothetical protein